MTMRSLPTIARDLVITYEGFSSVPYYDAAGYATIGYGHLILDNESFEHISKDDALTLLDHDLGIAQRAVERLVHHPLNDNQYGALTSFTFNLGSGALQRSTLRMKINRGHLKAAAEEFPRWVYADGRKLKGLVRRRHAEQALYLA